MTEAQIMALTDKQIAQAIADIGDHPFAERFVREQRRRAAQE
jgi:hypothetical protein